MEKNYNFQCNKMVLFEKQQHNHCVLKQFYQNNQILLILIIAIKYADGLIIIPIIGSFVKQGPKVQGLFCSTLLRS
jgi:hypothetical protein